MKLTPIREFAWPEPGSDHFKVTCKNHPTARYSTKHAFQRNLHFLQAADGFGYGQECPCPFGDLVVVTEDDLDEQMHKLVEAGEIESVGDGTYMIVRVEGQPNGNA